MQKFEECHLHTSSEEVALLKTIIIKQMNWRADICLGEDGNEQ